MTGKQLVGVWLHKPDATNRSRNVADRIVGVDMPVTIDECGAEQSRKWKRRNERSVRHIAHIIVHSGRMSVAGCVCVDSLVRSCLGKVSYQLHFVSAWGWPGVQAYG
jgi:hypothetical protein